MTPSLASLVADVYSLTNRPDLVGETLLAVRNATLKAHISDFYPKDIYETGVAFSDSLAQQSLEYKGLVPLFRALKYIRKYVPNVSGIGGRDGPFLDILTPDDLVDSYNCNKANVAYLAGSEIKIRSSEAIQYCLFGCYVYPNVTVDSYYSWIAEEQPTAILYEAAAVVFKTIGYDEQVATYRQMVADEYAILKQQIAVTGY